MATLQNAYLQLLLTECEETISDINRLAMPLGVPQINWKPTEKVWSVGQIIDHMGITNQIYHPQLEHWIKEVPRPGTIPTYKSTWMGRFVIQQLDPMPKHKMPSPKLFKPTASSYDSSVLDVFNLRLAKFRNLLVRMDGGDLNRAYMKSPANSLIRFNAGDYFRMECNHLARHRNQMKRVLQHEAFPK